MPNYRAPLQDMQFVITELAGLEGLAAFAIPPKVMFGIIFSGFKAEFRCGMSIPSFVRSTLPRSSG